MSGAEWGLAASVFLACGVEAVEALTIVLALGTTRSWSSTLSGAGAAILLLAALVAALGPALSAVPLGVLRVVVGVALLYFGAQWLRKAILRAAGMKALHDEAKEFAQTQAAARAAGTPLQGLDRYSFALSFKGVLLEGFEVVFIVLSFAADHHRVAIAGVAAGAAIAAVIALGVLVRAPLTRVPENAMKFAVGIMLCSFGIFWGVEGAGGSWPGSDAALLVLIPAIGLAAVAAVLALRRGNPGGKPA